LKYFAISLTSLGNFTEIGGDRLNTEASFLVSLSSSFFGILLILGVSFDATLLLKDVLLSIQGAFYSEL